MRDRIKIEALTKTGKINHHFINRLTEEEVGEIINITNFAPSDTSIKIRVKFIVDGVTEYPTCKKCPKPVRMHFKKLSLLDTCSKECDYMSRVNETKESNLLKYGNESTNRIKSVKEKQKSSMIKNHGVEFFTSSKDFTIKSKSSKLEKYGNENFVNPLKGKKTKLEKYGDENYNNHEKYIQTCIDKYGVEHVMQNKEIFEKQQAKCYGSKKYKHLYYRGTYELLFIQEFEKRYDLSDLKNCFSIKYKIKGKDKIYFPDFLISNKNVIIEIKSSWTYDNNGKNIELRELNEKKWEAAKSLTDYTFLPLKSKSEIKLYFNLLDKKLV